MILKLRALGDLRSPKKSLKAEKIDPKVTLRGQTLEKLLGSK